MKPLAFINGEMRQWLRRRAAKEELRKRRIYRRCLSNPSLSKDDKRVLSFIEYNRRNNP